jgi:hypothetical protein
MDSYHGEKEDYKQMNLIDRGIWKNYIVLHYVSKIVFIFVHYWGAPYSMPFVFLQPTPEIRHGF